MTFSLCESVLDENTGQISYRSILFKATLKCLKENIVSGIKVQIDLASFSYIQQQESNVAANSFN